MANPLVRCSKEVLENWHHRSCLAPVSVEREGKWYCASHDPVRVARKERERQVQYLERMAKEATARRSAKERCEKLGVGYPHYARPHPNRGGYFDGGVVLSAADADALIKRIELLQGSLRSLGGT